MGFFDSVLDFIDGVRSVIDVSGAAQGAISDAISSGIVSAFRKIRKPLEQSMLKISLMIAGVFFIVWGAAILLDSFVPYRGLGFVIVGAFIGMLALLFLQEKGAE